MERQRTRRRAAAPVGKPEGSDAAAQPQHLHRPRRAAAHQQHRAIGAGLSPTHPARRPAGRRPLPQLAQRRASQALLEAPPPNSPAAAPRAARRTRRTPHSRMRSGGAQPAPLQGQLRSRGACRARVFPSSLTAAFSAALQCNEGNARGKMLWLGRQQAHARGSLSRRPRTGRGGYGSLFCSSAALLHFNAGEWPRPWAGCLPNRSIRLAFPSSSTANWAPRLLGRRGPCGGERGLTTGEKSR